MTYSLEVRPTYRTFVAADIYLNLSRLCVSYDPDLFELHVVQYSTSNCNKYLSDPFPRL